MTNTNGGTVPGIWARHWRRPDQRRFYGQTAYPGVPDCQPFSRSCVCGPVWCMPWIPHRTGPKTHARDGSCRAGTTSYGTIAHLHLKDIDSTIAARVQSGQLTYSEARETGMYRPLGQGDVDVPAIVGHVRAHGYSGWYTLEQDTILTEEPKEEGPVADVRTSAEYLRTVLAQLP